MQPDGLTTLAAVGPLDDAALEYPTLRVCDVGHIAIAWRDWDARCCPLCQREGKLSETLKATHNAEIEQVENSRDEAIDEQWKAESAAADLRQAIKDAANELQYAADNEDRQPLGQRVCEIVQDLRNAL